MLHRDAKSQLDESFCREANLVPSLHIILSHSERKRSR